MPKNSGATLVEALIALAVGAIVVLGFLAAMSPVQSLSWDLSALHDRDSTLCLGPPLLCKWTAGAGNNRPSQGSNWVRTEAGTLQVQSDTEGPTGFPDGKLLDTYESISIRHNGGDLQIKSGTGSFQPVFRNVTGFSPSITDPRLLSMTLTAQTDKTLIKTPSTQPKRVAFLVYLWNYRPNLFEEAP